MEPRKDEGLRASKKGPHLRIHRHWLRASKQMNTRQRKAELGRVGKKLRALEGALFNDLDRLDRGVIKEDEFALRNEARRKDTASL